jgi:hypothetical protein
MLNALPAGKALWAIQLVPTIIHPMHRPGTDSRTRTAQDAAVAQEYDLGLRTAGFRAVTPATGERATLEIDRHTDSRSVVDGEGIYVEHEPIDISDRILDTHERPSWRRI